MLFEMARVGVWVQGWPQTHSFPSWMKTAAAAADPGILSGRYGSWGFKWQLGKVVTMVTVADGAPRVVCPSGGQKGCEVVGIKTAGSQR